MEVNAGQNATFQCIATGRDAVHNKLWLQVRPCSLLRERDPLVYKNAVLFVVVTLSLSPPVSVPCTWAGYLYEFVWLTGDL